jgi:hypothetical protein
MTEQSERDASTADVESASGYLASMEELVERLDKELAKVGRRYRWAVKQRDGAARLLEEEREVERNRAAA